MPMVVIFRHDVGSNQLRACQNPLFTRGATISILRMSGNSRTKPLNVDMASHDVVKHFKKNIKVNITKDREWNPAAESL